MKDCIEYLSTGVKSGASGLLTVFLEQALHIIPTDRRHKGVDIFARAGAIIHVIGMLIHLSSARIDCPPATPCWCDRPPTGSPAAGPAANRSAAPQPGPAAFRLAHSREFGAPALDTAEIARVWHPPAHRCQRRRLPGRRNKVHAGSWNSSRSSSSRFNPLTVKTGALAKSSSANCAPMAFNRRTAPA